MSFRLKMKHAKGCAHIISVKLLTNPWDISIYIPGTNRVELSTEISTFRQDGFCSTCYMRNTILQTAQTFVLDIRICS
jgi:hypothetical protein